MKGGNDERYLASYGRSALARLGGLAEACGSSVPDSHPRRKSGGSSIISDQNAFKRDINNNANDANAILCTLNPDSGDPQPPRTRKGQSDPARKKRRTEKYKLRQTSFLRKQRDWGCGFSHYIV